MCLTFDFRFLLKVVDQNSGDAMFQYNCCLIWCGLLHIVHTDRNDTITEKQLVSNWSLDIVKFLNNNHNKYLILGHILWADKELMK